VLPAGSLFIVLCAVPLLKIYPDNPQERLLAQVVQCLQADGVIIYPTDTVYALGCHIHSRRAIERICRIKGVDPEKHTFACIVPDLKAVGEYAAQLDNPTFKLMRRVLPGPYTFILPAGKMIPKHFQGKRKEFGVRMIDQPIVQELVRRLGNPLVTTSIKHEDEVLEYRTDPELIFEQYGHLVDFVIDGGYGGNIPSTVVDLTDGAENLRIIREGLGPVADLE